MPYFMIIMKQIRIDKYLSTMEVGSRSEIKKIIQKKRVSINGISINDAGLKVTPGIDEVLLDGKLIAYKRFRYYLFHKPAGCVSANSDAMHKTIMDYMKDAPGRDLFAVGRLDLDTEGLLIITNDGDFTHSLLSPNKHVEKEYYALIDGSVSERDVNAFKAGIDIGEKKICKSAGLKILESSDTSKVLITITEGRFHQVKRMVHAIGREVIYLKRLKMGRYELDETLLPGEYREFTKEELEDVERYKRGAI
ncbi:16S rRNA pseudouridine516 synthase [Eubacterium oxidoreducens]|uniref:Pseudouridine synthase n=2 Tax=Eubacterium oxidoreducens TaxID=1732 RepID=A0A1G6AM83_EUBOX|nr:16S rRNA pseudouridine516 synthase [Eubacterium oxidoreducens]